MTICNAVQYRGWKKRMVKDKEPIRQATISLPYFNHEVPVLYVEDGTPYIPVIALCDMLGLHRETHIPRWRRLVLWENARKLPLHTTRGKRMVWCLHMGALPFWCVCFDWSCVLPERRLHLQQAMDEWLPQVEQAHQVMLADYKHMRSLFFAFLTFYEDADAELRQFARLLSPCLDANACLQLEARVSQGRTLIAEATTHVRNMVHEQATMPIVDAVSIDLEGEVSETYSLPLFPVVLREDRAQFFEYVSRLTSWYRDMLAFLKEQGLTQNESYER